MPSPELLGVSATNCIIPSSSTTSGVGLVMMGLGARPAGTAESGVDGSAINAGIAETGRCPAAAESTVDASACP